jgi:hypothetical protein
MDAMTCLARAKRVRRAQTCAEKRCKTALFWQKKPKTSSLGLLGQNLLK